MKEFWKKITKLFITTRWKIEDRMNETKVGRWFIEFFLRLFTLLSVALLIVWSALKHAVGIALGCIIVLWISTGGLALMLAYVLICPIVWLFTGNTYLKEGTAVIEKPIYALENWIPAIIQYEGFFRP